jgi:hypothetical protein
LYKLFCRGAGKDFIEGGQMQEAKSRLLRIFIIFGLELQNQNESKRQNEKL